MALVQIKVVYSYYSTERVTPIFVSEEELLDLNYDAFKWKIVKEIPHLGKITDTTSLHHTVLNQGYYGALSGSKLNVQTFSSLNFETSLFAYNYFLIAALF